MQQDLARTIYGLTRGVSVSATLESFRAGYQTVRPWPQLEDRLLADLLAARRLMMVNLAIGVGRPDLSEYTERHAQLLRSYVDAA